MTGDIMLPEKEWTLNELIEEIRKQKIELKQSLKEKKREKRDTYGDSDNLE